MTKYKVTYNLQLQCCSGYGPMAAGPNCLRKLYLLLTYTEHYNIII